MRFVNKISILMFLKMGAYTVNIVLVRTAKNNYFSLCTNY